MPFSNASWSTFCAQSYEVQAFSQADTFAVGDAVYYSQVCGSGYIRRLNG